MTTPHDVMRFTQGDCHILAIEIHKRTGWPVYTLREVGDELFPDYHAFVRTPDGCALDITGKRPMHALVRDWSEEMGTRLGWMKVEPDDLTSWGWENWDDSEKRAQELAPELIATSLGGTDDE